MEHQANFALTYNGSGLPLRVLMTKPVAVRRAVFPPTIGKIVPQYEKGSAFTRAITP